jgi:hypothetical protein
VVGNPSVSRKGAKEEAQSTLRTDCLLACFALLASRLGAKGMKLTALYTYGLRRYGYGDFL